MNKLSKYHVTALASAISLVLVSNVNAQTTQANADLTLEEIIVSAQKRQESAQEVPISIASLSGEQFDTIFSGGEDILALSSRVPGLYAESSNGRVAPRFYIRGLGNIDFDLAASQPVSIVFDNVVQENVVLKSFPIFDVEQVEVIRGPQGTLFGRNTTAGIIKFDTRKPTQEAEGYLNASYGTFDTVNIEAAVGGALVDDVLSTRVSVLSQTREDWIDNSFTGQADALGGHKENAARIQFLYTPTDSFSALFNYHIRDLDGTASVFRANIFTTGSNDLNENFDRDVVNHNQGDNNPQEYEASGGSLKLDWEFDAHTLTSITGYEESEGFSLGDIDGGTAQNNPNAGPGFIPFDAVTQDNADVEQLTQEIRIASNYDGRFNWQAGAFFFDSTLDVSTTDGFFGRTTVSHENTTWAFFGQVSYDLSESLTLSGGLRYTDDEKDLVVLEQNVDSFALSIGQASIQTYEPVNVADDQLSGDISVNYRLSDTTSLYTRVSSGFRAQSIQARDVAFEGNPSVADSETITSYELGFKSDLFSESLRLNAALFYYEIDDIQLSAIGGANNGNSLLNADKGVGQGFEVDMEYVPTSNLRITAGFSYNDTEIQDSDLLTAPCGSGACTVLDPIVTQGGTDLALIDGNPFQSAPETIFNFTLRYQIPAGDSGQFFAFTDWAFQGETSIALYEAAEFITDDQFEGGLRLGYENFEDNYQIALFGRNITDEENVKGIIDFNNNTGFVNQPRIVGVEFNVRF
ncbi:TonB-dependent receptor [Agarilytica rhodophyticola]|uniref:TonB-dependent receptor n=1 Tax=Agarilytica rhodophyticola TaxID=1737490 RepID=UPI000B3456B5|nr:TonB-dependent receptor [Agarilytica rhodophyticola]